MEQMAQVAGELVDEAISEQKNQPNGIAGLDSSGKLQQMPTANDIGAVSVGTTGQRKSVVRQYHVNGAGCQCDCKL